MTQAGRPQQGYQIRKLLKQDRTPDSTILADIPPPEESLSEYAASMWTYICSLKRDENDLRDQWLPIIHTLAKTYELEAMLEEQSHTPVLQDHNGKPYANPSIGMLRQVRSDISGLLTKLNLTPASLARSKSPTQRTPLTPPTSVPAKSFDHSTARSIPIPGMN